MIALIIFVFGDLCIFLWDIYTMIPLIIFVFAEFCIFNGRRVDVVAKTAMIPLIIIFFCGKLAALDGFFLLAAAWVDPGRSALQSAEQRCQRRYGRIHQVGWMSIYDKNMQKGQFESNTQKESKRRKPSTD